MSLKLRTFAGAALLALSANIHANTPVATISQFEGNVLIEHAKERMPAKEGMILQEGDFVYVLEKANIDLQYATCHRKYEQNTLVEIHHEHQCKDGIVMNENGAASGNTGSSGGSTSGGSGGSSSASSGGGAGGSSSGAGAAGGSSASAAGAGGTSTGLSSLGMAGALAAGITVAVVIATAVSDD